MKNKTIALWLCFLGGAFGLHRLYLRGQYDAIAFATTCLTLCGLYGVYRARTLGVDDPLSWVLIPILGFTLSGCALNAIVFGLMGTKDWNARFNPGLESISVIGETTKMTVAGLVAALFLGATILMASLAYSFEHYFALDQAPVAEAIAP